MNKNNFLVNFIISVKVNEVEIWTDNYTSMKLM